MVVLRCSWLLWGSREADQQQRNLALVEESFPPFFCSGQTALLTSHSQQYQALLDQSTPYVLYRWVGTAIVLILFFVRIFVMQGWYIGG